LGSPPARLWGALRNPKALGCTGHRERLWGTPGGGVVACKLMSTRNCVHAQSHA